MEVCTLNLDGVLMCPAALGCLFTSAEGLLETTSRDSEDPIPGLVGAGLVHGDITRAWVVAFVGGTSAKLEEATEHAAIYWPRVRILNPAKAILGNDDTLTVPPSGIICGVYGRNDGAQPGGIYDPPAGIEKGKVLGVVGFENDEALEEAKRDLIYPWRINPLTTGPGMPRYIDGSRTLKGTSSFPYIAERRGVTFIERSLKEGLQFGRHRNNTEALRAQVQRKITSFLMTQMNNGAFRSKEPEKAFFVDLSENGEDEILAGRLNVRVGLATNKPAEFAEIRISQIVEGG